MFEEIIKKYSLDLEEYDNEGYLTTDYGIDRYYSKTTIEGMVKELDFGYDPIYFKDYGCLLYTSPSPRD